MESANGDGRAPSSETPNADEIEQLLQSLVPAVLKWIRDGEQGGVVLPQATANEAREQIKLPPIGPTGLGDAAAKRETERAVATLAQVVDPILSNSVNPWTGRFLDKLYSAPQPIGIAADLLLSTLNANCHVFSASPVLTLSEELCVRELCRLCGWVGSQEEEDLYDGLTMPGGSASNTLALQTALSHHFPSYKKHGVLGAVHDLSSTQKELNFPTHASSVSETFPEKNSFLDVPKLLIMTSEQSHYSIEKAALACGLGLDSVIRVACDESGRMKPDALRDSIETCMADGRGYPFFLNATSGTTVQGAFDNLSELASIAESTGLWLHVDGSWGGPVLFSEKWRHLMQGIEKCDSLTINPHKLLNVPLQCSFLLFRRGKEALQGNSLDASYLFHSSEMRDNPGMKTLGCGRRGDAIKLYLAWLCYGTHGLGEHVERGMDLARETIAMIRGQPDILQLYPPPEPAFLQVCFRPYRAGFSDQQLSSIVKEVREALHAQRMFAVDFAPLPGARGDFVRLVTHPRTAAADLQTLVNAIATLGQAALDAHSPPSEKKTD